MASTVLGAAMPLAQEEPMYVTSPLAASPAPGSEEVQAFFDVTDWENQPMPVYDKAGCTYYGLPSVMNMSKLASGPPMYSDGSYAQAEKHETGSDASTADTSPHILDEGFYADALDMSWHGVFQPLTGNLAFPTFSHSTSETRSRLPSCQEEPTWQQSGWGERQHFPETTQQKQRSVGTDMHALGQCKPCAFAWKPEGCGSGAECKFCHLCPPNEKQRRKRVLRQIQRTVGIYK